MTPADISKRFDHLVEQFAALEAAKVRKSNSYGSFDAIDGERSLQWAVSAKHIISIACGSESIHLQAFSKHEKATSVYQTHYERFKLLKNVLIAARDDYVGGYIVSLKKIVQAEIFDSGLDQARHLLDNSYKDAAAVIAGTVLETYLRELCKEFGVAPAMINRMNDDLVKAGAYNSLQAKQINAWAGIRNSAAHGKGHEFEAPVVSNMIDGLESFLTRNLS